MPSTRLTTATHAPRPLGKDYWLGPGMRICLGIKAPAAGEELSLRDGPVPAPMERRAGRYRAQLLLQANARAPLHRP